MIAVFSGTGNSMYVARCLAKILGDRVVSLPTAGKDGLCADNDRVIWVFPVYSWGIPPVLGNIIKSIEIEGAGSAEHFAVMTCGDDTGYTDRTWRKAIGRRGWKPCGAWSVRMPNTYVCMKGFDVDSVDVAQAKIAAAQARVAAVARGISERSDARDVVRGAFPLIKTYVIRPWFVRHAMSPRTFHSTDDCIGCSVCADNCPLGNIEMRERRPVWGDDCAMCLRCYHICPRHAVAWGKASRGKGQSRELINYVYKGRKDV